MDIQSSFLPVYLVTPRPQSICRSSTHQTEQGKKVQRPTNKAKSCKAAGQAKATHGNGSLTHSIAIREGNSTPLEGPRPIQSHWEGNTLHQHRVSNPARLPQARLHAHKRLTVYKQKHSFVNTEQMSS